MRQSELTQRQQSVRSLEAGAIQPIGAADQYGQIRSRSLPPLQHFRQFFAARSLTANVESDNRIGFFYLP
jgi:hypothetical protein